MSADTQTFALCRLGAFQFGTPIEQVVCALHLSDNFTTLPRRQGAIDGVISHRSTTIPLVNLGFWLEPSQPLPVSNTPLVVVLSDGSRQLGVGIEALDGLWTCENKHVVKVCHQTSGEEIFNAVAQRGDGNEMKPAIPVLDASRLMDMAKVWAEGQNTTTNLVGFKAHIDEPSRWFVVFAVGSFLIAIQTDMVSSVVTVPQYQKLVGGGPGVMGIARWREKDIPVLNSIEALGLGNASENPSLMLILKHAEQHIGLVAESIQSVKPFGTNNIQLPDGVTIKTTSPIEGELLTPTGDRIFVVDPLKLFASCPLSNISGGAQEAATDDRTTNSEAYVVFEAGDVWALALTALEAVIEVPSDVLATTHKNPAYLGSLIWRGQSVPLWDLKRLTQQGKGYNIGQKAKVLLAKYNGQLCGLLVSDLKQFLPVRSGVLTRLDRPSGPIDLITIPDGTGQRTYRLMVIGDWIPG